MTQTQQLELTLASRNPDRGINSRGRATQRADWWFTQMRRAVERAAEWSRPDPGNATSPAPVATRATSLHSDVRLRPSLS